jgi:ABC-type sugar transport system permease subunit
MVGDRRRLAARLAAVALVVGLAALTRAIAVDRLPIDYDEDDYLRAGQIYAEGFQAGDPGVLLRENYRPEHPPLTKILTGVVLTPLEPAPLVPDLPTTAAQAASLPEPHHTVARVLQAAFAIAAVVVLAILDPLAGGVLAVHTWTIKYSSQVQLEAVPVALTLVAVLAWMRADRVDPAEGDRGRSRRRVVWLVVSAVALGLAVAAKYPYAIAGVAIALTWLARRPAEGAGADPADGAAARPASTNGPGLARRLSAVAAWAALAVGAFFLAAPYLWPDPLGRLWASLTYHGGYAVSDAVQQTGWPAWQPLTWLAGSVPWHRPGTFLVAVDLAISAFALVGLPRLWARQRVVAVWLLLALAFLLLWPTKWPQYVLMLSAPLSLAAAHGIRAIALEPAVDRWREWRGRRVARHLRPAVATLGPRPRSGRRRLVEAAPWLLPGALALAVLALLPLAYEVAMSLTDFSRASIRDGINGGVVREAVGGVTGAIPATPWDPRGLSSAVRYVAGDLLGGFTNGTWLGSNTSAALWAFSALWAVLAVGLQTVVGVGVALVLARPGLRFASAWRLLFILPWAIPEFVGAIAWRTIVHPETGWLALGLATELPWPGSPELSLLVLLVASTWMGFPLMMLVASAGLTVVPRGAVEAAAIDGASTWRRIRSIVLPLLLPLLGAAIVIRGIAAFNQFYLFYVLGPSSQTVTSATWSFYIFDSQSGPGWYSVSAAINVATLVGLGLVVAWFLGWRGRGGREVYA